MTEKDHIIWCKQRANKYVAAGDYQQAISSMLSDLGKHDETKRNLSWAGGLALVALQEGTSKAADDFINGFAE